MHQVQETFVSLTGGPHTYGAHFINETWHIQNFCPKIVEKLTDVLYFPCVKGPYQYQIRALLLLHYYWSSHMWKAWPGAPAWPTHRPIIHHIAQMSPSCMGWPIYDGHMYTLIHIFYIYIYIYILVFSCVARFLL